MFAERTDAGGLGEDAGAALSHPVDGWGAGGLPLVLLDEEGQLGSSGAQKALHAGLRRLHVLDQVLPVAKPLTQVVPLTSLEKVH